MKHSQRQSEKPTAVPAPAAGVGVVVVTVDTVLFVPICDGIGVKVHRGELMDLGANQANQHGDTETDRILVCPEFLLMSWK